MSDLVYKISIWVLPLVFAITFHEVAHGWVADRLGDDTARRMGRITLNPIRHIDNFGTLMLPGLLLIFTPFVFGYAKPVPVNFARLNSPKRDMVWVALAGPGMNISLALASAGLLHLVFLLPASLIEWPALTLTAAILINVILAVQPYWARLILLPPKRCGWEWNAPMHRSISRMPMANLWVMTSMSPRVSLDLSALIWNLSARNGTA